VLAFRALTARNVSVRDVLPGAVMAALAWQVLQSVGTAYVGYQLQGSSQVYGLFGIVLGLFAWIYLEAVIIVLAAELNVVLRERLWPRALLAPVCRGRRPHARRSSQLRVLRQHPAVPSGRDDQCGVRVTAEGAGRHVAVLVDERGLPVVDGSRRGSVGRHIQLGHAVGHGGMMHGRSEVLLQFPCTMSWLKVDPARQRTYRRFGWEGAAPQAGACPLARKRS
jgi:hypothetical protein